MAEIYLIIKIPAKQYKNIMEYEGNANMISDMTLSEINDYLHQYIKGVYTGKPLPKGYGKLIDADEEIKKFCSKVCGHTLEECRYGFYCPLVKKMISAPAVIEADNKFL